MDNDIINQLARLCLRIVFFACSMFVFRGVCILLSAGSRAKWKQSPSKPHGSPGAAEAVPASNEALFQGRVFVAFTHQGYV